MTQHDVVHHESESISAVMLVVLLIGLLAIAFFAFIAFNQRGTGVLGEENVEVDIEGQLDMPEVMPSPTVPDNNTY